MTTRPAGNKSRKPSPVDKEHRLLSLFYPVIQKFLQKKGYYKGYKIDGDYLKYTKQEVNKLQKAYKIKVSKQNQGQWDKVTRDYWRKKYNITSKKKKK